MRNTSKSGVYWAWNGGALFFLPFFMRSESGEPAIIFGGESGIHVIFFYLNNDTVRE